MVKASDLEVKVYTLAFREIQDKVYPSVPAGVNALTLELKDRRGTNLANGLYYLVVSTPDNRAVLKLLVAR